MLMFDTGGPRGIEYTNDRCGVSGVATTTLSIESYLEAFFRGAKEISRAVVYAISAFPLLIGVILVLNHFMAQREELA